MFTININTEDGMFYFKDPSNASTEWMSIDWIDDNSEIFDIVGIPVMPFFEDYNKMNFIFSKDEIPNGEFFFSKSFLLRTLSKTFIVADHNNDVYGLFPTANEVTEIFITSYDKNFSNVFCYIKELNEEL